MTEAAVRVGCSGWQYRDWRHTVYDGAPMATWFERYATRFDTVELNSTFYRLPERSTVERWAEVAPPGFLYAVKLGQFGSHRMKLRDAGSWLPNHTDRLDLFGDSAGPTLVQLPPKWHVDVERLDEFLGHWPFDRYRIAVEFRHPSWLRQAVFDVLSDHGAALCIHDLIPDHPFCRTTDWTYLRFHGVDPVNHPYQGRYGPSRLTPVVECVRPWMEEGCDVFAYFNNDWDANAVADATWLRDQLAPRESPNSSDATERSTDAGTTSDSGPSREAKPTR